MQDLSKTKLCLSPAEMQKFIYCSVYELLSRQRLTEVFSATDKVDYCSACMAFNCSIHGLIADAFDFI